MNCETVGKMVRSANEPYLIILSPFPKCDFDTNEVSALSNFDLHPLHHEIHWNKVSLYKDIKYVFSDYEYSDFFVSRIGVHKGENVSLLLFAGYVNDLETHLWNNGINAVELSM